MKIEPSAEASFSYLVKCDSKLYTKKGFSFWAAVSPEVGNF